LRQVYKTDDNRALFFFLIKITANAVCAAKRRLSDGYLNPKLPSKSLWRNFKFLSIKDELEYEIIFSAEELN
jgi:hypothetical protein